MVSVSIAYGFIFVTLVGYGITLYRRSRQVDAALRAHDEK